MNKMDHRHFVHEMANKLTVIEGSLAIALRKLKDNTSVSAEVEKIQKSYDYLNQSIKILKDYRERIHKEIPDDPA